MILAIDFDGVIHNTEDVVPGYKMGKPMHFARESMEVLKQRGNKLIVFTVRGSAENKKHVEEWLDYFAIPYDLVTNIKPEADVYIDDRAVRFVNWPFVLKTVIDAEHNGLIHQ